MRRVAILALLVLAGCSRRDTPTGGGAVGGGARPSAVDQWAPKKGDPVADGPSPSVSEPEAPAGDAPVPPEEAAQPLGPSIWKLGELTDVGPAGPMLALPDGVLVVAKTDRMYFAKRRESGGFEELNAPAEDFARFGRGPAVSSEYAYWVTRDGRLLRGHLETGEMTVLLTGAHPGARPSALTVDERDVVAFLREEGDAGDAETLAYLWASPPPRKGPDAAEIVRLTPEGAATTSVTLVGGAPFPLAVSLEGRSSMSPLHTRTVRVTERRVTLTEDRVVWVGPGSHPLTEVVTLGEASGHPLALIATARDMTHFGLAQVRLGESGPAPDPSWRLYPNGLDPAPVEAAEVCGAEYALFVLPSESRPRAPQELRIARRTESGLVDEEVLARSRAFNDVSIAPRKGGAVLAWTADRRTWALDLGCPSSKKQARARGAASPGAASPKAVSPAATSQGTATK